ncbi:MAG: right-handed parallel beta-helix repeat-containing protein [Anaerolineae bacterium]|nr:right-handed parallel beta-helix repeat-containing protein [Anaerolineae bacterium]
MKRFLKKLCLYISITTLLTLSLPSPDPVWSATLEVVSMADSGPGTLRQALLDARPGDIITFNPTVFPSNSPSTIFVRSNLPVLNKNNLTLDASNAGVILDGSQMSSGTSGLTIDAANCVVRGLTIQRFPENGIWIEVSATGNIIGGNRNLGAGPHGQGNLIILNGTTGVSVRGDNNQVLGNYIGIDRTGTYNQGNLYSGVALWEGASNNIIGGNIAGYRNVISGNVKDGIWIYGPETTQNQIIGNYIGMRADGAAAISNGQSGIGIHGGAHHNAIGGSGNGEGNLISGNLDVGVFILGAGTDYNQILGNIIGANSTGDAAVGQVRYGIAIVDGASNNRVGDGSAGGRNVISGNQYPGIAIWGSETMSNSVQGNYIGTNKAGTARLANKSDGIVLDNATSGNVIEENVISGNGADSYGNGIIVIGSAHHNLIRANLIGLDKTGSYAIGGQPGGGLDLADGARQNLVGGPTAADRNVLSGNGVDGIFLAGETTRDNVIQGNYIGTDISGALPVPNPWGLFIVAKATDNRITDNLVRYNKAHGIEVKDSANNIITDNTVVDNGEIGIHFTESAHQYIIEDNEIARNGQEGVRIESSCDQITVHQNSIYANAKEGIYYKGSPSAPTLKIAKTLDVVTGTTVPLATVALYADEEEEGQTYIAATTADTRGFFTFTQPGGFTGPNLTVLSTDEQGNTSEFSKPLHLLWTLLLYLNGDNDLQSFMANIVSNITSSPSSPRANVLALVDGLGYTETLMLDSGTILYDLTWGEATQLYTSVITEGERNMGDGQTLVDFVNWGRDYAPANYTMLAIVDHGGGWAPGTTDLISGTMPIRRTGWMAGSSGLSWDFNSDYDYLDSEEIRQAMAHIAQKDGPLEIVFYDVCLMGMLEVAYQIKDYASFFVSSQNIGWAPLGPDGRYVRIIRGIQAHDTPRDVAHLLVDAYANAMARDLHPFTISAVDLTTLVTTTEKLSHLVAAITQTLTLTDQISSLRYVYTQTQKLDYDSDFHIEPERDGFVDLYDLATQMVHYYTQTEILAAAQGVKTALEQTIVAEAHQSGSPWFSQDLVWDLEDVHGLSIFLPFGEDLELPVMITDTEGITRNVRLRDMYTGDQLQFLADSGWKALIDTYYEVGASEVTTDTTQGPVEGLLIPDVSPPQTYITVTGSLTANQDIYLTWDAMDDQSGTAGATFWYRSFGGEWTNVGLTMPVSSGLIPFKWSRHCEYSLAVRAVDKAGNVEPLYHGPNTLEFVIAPCLRLYLPLTMRGYEQDYIRTTIAEERRDTR